MEDSHEKPTRVSLRKEGLCDSSADPAARDIDPASAVFFCQKGNYATRLSLLEGIAQRFLGTAMLVHIALIDRFSRDLGLLVTG
jgi:hypothetical protein